MFIGLITKMETSFLTYESTNFQFCKISSKRLILRLISWNLKWTLRKMEFWRKKKRDRYFHPSLLPPVFFSRSFISRSVPPDPFPLSLFPTRYFPSRSLSPRSFYPILFPLGLGSLSLKPTTFEDIHLPPLVNEATGERILNFNQLVNTNQLLNNN